MTMLGSLIKRHTALTICAGGALALMVFVGVFLQLPEPAKRNRAQLVRALAKPRIDWSSGDHSRIERVVLAGRITLVPEVDQILAGYVVRLHTRSSAFTIEARPLVVGKTGLFSYFRDEAGVIRFEPEPGKPAGAESRRWTAVLDDLQ